MVDVVEVVLVMVVPDSISVVVTGQTVKIVSVSVIVLVIGRKVVVFAYIGPCMMVPTGFTEVIGRIDGVSVIRGTTTSVVFVTKMAEVVVNVFVTVVPECSSVVVTGQTVVIVSVMVRVFVVKWGT